MKVKIVKCSKEAYWYKKEIGKVFESTKFEIDNSKIPTGALGALYIDIDDCEIVKEVEECKLDINKSEAQKWSEIQQGVKKTIDGIDQLEKLKEYFNNQLKNVISTCNHIKRNLIPGLKTELKKEFSGFQGIDRIEKLEKITEELDMKYIRTDDMQRVKDDIASLQNKQDGINEKYVAILDMIEKKPASFSYQVWKIKSKEKEDMQDKMQTVRGDKKEKKGTHHVNQKFRNIISEEVYVIKGAWMGSHPENDHCFLIRENGLGHVYSGKVTKVNSVWNITDVEFYEMTGKYPERFTLIEDS